MVFWAGSLQVGRDVLGSEYGVLGPDSAMAHSEETIQTEWQCFGQGSDLLLCWA